MFLFLLAWSPCSLDHREGLGVTSPLPHALLVRDWPVARANRVSVVVVGLFLGGGSGGGC